MHCVKCNLDNPDNHLIQVSILFLLIKFCCCLENKCFLGLDYIIKDHILYKIDPYKYTYLTPSCRWVDISTWRTPAPQYWLYLRHSS